MDGLDEFKRTCDEKHTADRGRLDKLENTVQRIFEILDKYKERPTWMVASVLVFLSTALGIVLTALLEKWGGR
jgi:hypothetical protein